MNRKFLGLIIVLLAAVVLPAQWAPAGSALPNAVAPVSLIPGEPNDTFGAAIPFDLYAHENAKGYFLTAADVDFYRIEAATPVELTAIATTGYAFGHTTMTAEIAIYDATHTLVTQNTGCNDPAETITTLSEGTAFVRVRPCAAGLDIDKDYRLEIYADALEMEPNNTRQTANGGLAPYNEYVNYNVWQSGAVSPSGDVDFYRIQGAADQAFHAQVDAAEGTAPLSLALMAADGTILAEGAPCWYDAGDSCMDTILPDGATWYLRVRSAAHPTGSGPYSLYTVLEVEQWDIEPNSTPAEAIPVGYGTEIDVDGSDEGDVDYYRFNGQAGTKVRLLILEDFDMPYDAGLLGVELFDPSMNPVTLSGDPIFRGTLPSTGMYTLKITTTYDAGEYDYLSVTLDRDKGSEPNDNRQAATPIEIGPELDIVFDYPCDTDWFVFNGRAGDALRSINTEQVSENVRLYAADGTPMTGHVLPADGTYYLRAQGYYSDKWDNYCYEGPETHPFGEALWVSPAANKFAGDKLLSSGDIVTRKSAAGQWQIVFDASDVGITKNVVAIERMPNGSILMSLSAAQNVAGLGKVQPQDIIRFNPTSLGDTTAGTFEWFLDGSDVGLTTAGEKIDAIYMQQDIENPLRISLAGSGSVARVSGGTLKVADEDILNLVGGVFGANSAGAWRMSLDGSAVPGLAKEDISNLARVEVYPAHDSVLLLGLDSAFTVNGTSGTMFDVMNGDTWLPAVRQLTNKKIDGLAVGPAQTP